jgi:hypothetical protein
MADGSKIDTPVQWGRRSGGEVDSAQRPRRASEVMGMNGEKRGEEAKVIPLAARLVVAPRSEGEPMRREVLETVLMARMPRIEHRRLLDRVRYVLEMAFHERLPDDWDTIVDWCAADDDRRDDAFATVIGAYALLQRAAADARLVKRSRGPGNDGEDEDER